MINWFAHIRDYNLPVDIDKINLHMNCARDTLKTLMIGSKSIKGSYDDVIWGCYYES